MVGAALIVWSINEICSGVASLRTNTIISTSPRHCTSRLSNARWIKNVVPTNSSAIADVRMAATVSVRLRLKLAHISRNAYAIRAIIRTPRALGRAR